MITPVKVPETPIIVTRPEPEPETGEENIQCELLDTESPPPLSPPLCDEDPEDPGDQDQAASEHSDQCQEAQDVPVATLVTTA